ncbi:MAG: GGDEF domain-containing protein, partial [Thermoleophilia bacterium]
QYDGTRGISESVSRRLREEVLKIGYGRKRVLLFALTGVLVGVLVIVAFELLVYVGAPDSSLILVLFLPIIGFGMAIIARRETAIHERSEELERTRLRISQLMAKAAREGRKTVFEDDRLPTCWRELECDEEDCPVYGREHTRCWLIAGTLCRSSVQGKFARKLKDCRLCAIYRQATSDPVSEITESFYAMNYLLGEREEQIEEAYEQSRVRGEKLARLVKLSDAALSSVHLSDLLRNLLDSAAVMIGADFGFVSLVDREEASLVVRDTYGLESGAAARLSVKVGEGILGQAYEGGYIAVAEDMDSDIRSVSELLREIGARTLISLPLVGRERPLGMLTLGTLTFHHYTDEEKDSLCVAADHIAMTVENTRLEGQVDSGLERVEMLAAANRDLGTGGGIDHVYGSFVNYARRLVEYDRVCLMILNADRSEFEIVAAETLASRTWLGQGIRLPFEALPYGPVINDRRPLVRSTISGEDFPADKLLLEEGISSEVVIPLAAEGRVLGILSLGSFQPNAFTRDDAAILQPMTRQLSMIIDNARLLQDVKRYDLVDKLTQLYNHRFFFDALSREVARSRRDGSSVSVMVIDIVNFKEFNTRTSRAEGDRVLQGIAESLRSTVREIDIVARYGGDKFAVLLPDASAAGEDSEVVRVASRIQEEIVRSVLRGSAADMKLCIGAADFPAHAGDTLSLLERADWAVREARLTSEASLVVATAADGAAEVDDRPGA